MQAPTLLPPGTGLSRNGVLSYHAVMDGPQPGSSRTRVQIITPDDKPPQFTAQTAQSDELAENVIQSSPPTLPEIPTGTPFKHPQSSMPAPQFTENDELDLLFDPKLISPAMHETVGSHLHVRRLMVPSCI